jgi:hypothetical protein
MSDEGVDSVPRGSHRVALMDSGMGSGKHPAKRGHDNGNYNWESSKLERYSYSRRSK